MALFKKKNTNKLSLTEPDAILGYLDELIAKKIPLTVTFNKKSFSCNLYGFEPDNKLIRIQNIQPLFKENGKTVTCGFPLDRAWFVFQTKLVVLKDNLFIETPEIITYAERRKTKRAVFSVREEVKVTVVESLGKGTGVFGSATNVSEGGICLTIDKAMLLNNEKIISPHPDLYKKGTEIMLVKINKIPGGKPFETSGKINRVFKDGGKWKLALEFGKLPKSGTAFIQTFVNSRTSDFKLTRRSRKKRIEMERNRQAFTPPATTAKKTNTIKSKESLQPAVEQSRQANTVEHKQVNNTPVTVVSLGCNLKKQLSFLDSIPSVRWEHAENQIQILALIHDVKADVLLLQYQLGDHNMLDYLQKIQSMKLVGNIKTAIFSENPISVKDKIKAKLVNVDTFFKLPLTDKLELVNFIKNAKANNL
jgi:c-di-GMP-binding flagellar brake protein YcgR